MILLLLRVVHMPPWLVDRRCSCVRAVLPHCAARLPVAGWLPASMDRLLCGRVLWIPFVFLHLLRLGMVLHTWLALGRETRPVDMEMRCCICVCGLLQTLSSLLRCTIYEH